MRVLKELSLKMEKHFLSSNVLIRQGNLKAAKPKFDFCLGSVLKILHKKKPSFLNCHFPSVQGLL